MFLFIIQSNLRLANGYTLEEGEEEVVELMFKE